ncbi:MAG: hypothetical protein RLZZ292_1485 [Bacteroidota bacterium]|jgi:DNA-binding NarL/FixJ family response regulator
MTRIILFEDNERSRKSMERLLKNSETLFLAAALPDAQNAIRDVKKYEPDVILMDIMMPNVMGIHDATGIQALSLIKARFPEVKIIMLTGVQNNDAIFSAICNGASGYVLKGDANNIEQTILEVVEHGVAHLSPDIAGRMMDLMRKMALSPPKHYTPLTLREKDVLTEMVNGKSRRQIGIELKISVDVVGDHLKSIYRKLQVNSAPEAVREAILRGIV